MPVKKLVILVLASFIIASCASSGNLEKKIQIAQALKKEGDIFQTQGDYTAALTRLLEAEKIMSRDPYLQNSLGLAYMGKRRDDLAVTAFKKALAIKPDYVEATNNLGAAYLRQKKWDMAIENFNKVLDNLLYPTPHYPLSNIGWAYLGKNEFSVAEVYFKKALDQLPWFTAAAHGLAQVYLRTGQEELATLFLNQCITKFPEIAIFHADRAQAYEANGLTNQAIKSWQRVLTLVPERSALAKQAVLKLSELN